MSWYKNMGTQQRRAFRIVIAVCAVGAIAVLFAPMAFRLL